MLRREGLDDFGSVLSNAFPVLEPHSQPGIVNRKAFSSVDLPAGLPQGWFGTHLQMVAARSPQALRRHLAGERASTTTVVVWACVQSKRNAVVMVDA